MKKTGCKNESRILEALRDGCKPEAFEESLREHVAGCISCAELVYVHELFQKDGEQMRVAAPIPEAGRIWWRAQMATRRACAERALRPIAIAERAAFAAGSVALVAFSFFVAPQLSGPLARLSSGWAALINAFWDSYLNIWPASSLIAVSAMAGILLMAGSIYILLAEK